MDLPVGRVGRTIPIEGRFGKPWSTRPDSSINCCCIYYSPRRTLVRDWIFRIANGPVINQRSNQ